MTVGRRHSRPKHRRFTLADAMILVASSAVGIALLRTASVSVPVSNSYPAIETLYASAWLPCLWSVAIVLIRLRGPCPGRRRLARRPGWMACLGALVGAMILVVENGGSFVVHRIRGSLPVPFLTPGSWVWMTTRGLWAGPGLMVVAVWMTLAVGGRWRTERAWDERVGLALGAYWILLLVARPVVEMVAAS